MLPPHVPAINYNFWYEESLRRNSARNNLNQPIVDRHYSVITNCFNKYNAGIRSAYFTRYPSLDEIIYEMNRLRNLTYLDLENEVINLISIYRGNNFIEEHNENELLLKIFDLIQIWGGTPGGGGPYNAPSFTRADPPKSWINSYKKGIIEASKGNLNSYQLLMDVTHLGLPFASKHAFYFSKHLENKALIIIDLKIAQCFGYRNVSNIHYDEITSILASVTNLATQNNLLRWQVEKALFTFHLNYFENGNLINQNIRAEDQNEVDWFINNLFA